VSETPDPRAYPDRPFVAVSAVIARDDRILLVERARSPSAGIYTLPGGVVETGETLIEAVKREVLEETALIVEPVALAGHREVILRDDASKVARHFIVLAFATRWVTGEVELSPELAAARWVTFDAVAGFRTTEGLAEIIHAGLVQLGIQTAA
jgi:ADP-ribose pyrophosphatase YjhB (NUDIX family)